MKKTILLLVIASLATLHSAYAQTLHLWKGGVALNGISLNEVDSVRFVSSPERIIQFWQDGVLYSKNINELDSISFHNTAPQLIVDNEEQNPEVDPEEKTPEVVPEEQNPETTPDDNENKLTELGATFVMVDLGLPSGLMWASWNLGATNATESGYYYAWGATDTSEVYDWIEYKYANDSYYNLTKYCTISDYGNNGFVDTRTKLLPEDDVAHVLLGGNWRMPTYADIQELRSQDNCKWVWTTIDGVNGYKVIGPNGNYIFLPAAGWRSDDSLLDQGSDGRYWSSTLEEDGPYHAQYLGFYPSGLRIDSGYSRYYGLSIRPVCTAE